MIWFNEKMQSGGDEMSRNTKQVPKEEIIKQLETCDIVRQLLAKKPKERKALVDTYGCQQNEADSEQICGMLSQMGYGFTDNVEEADLVLLNTCAIREHAEQRVFGNVGALVHSKRRNKDKIICVCGCMPQQEYVTEKIKRSYPHVDLVFGTHKLWQFPSLLLSVLQNKKRVFAIEDEGGRVAEGLPVLRKFSYKASVPIVNGCNNFCTYCIVPYVRGRERSREIEDIVREVKDLVNGGCREITLLGQNVNSYGKDLEKAKDFSDLLIALAQLDGDFLIRFMTSHPKDASDKLFAVMEQYPNKIAPQLHLPVQSGSTRVLTAMNRGYTREKYLELIRQVRARIPDITLTSDIIVGFPGETQEEFEETLSLIELVEFEALFTFVFSARKGTPAEHFEDPMPIVQKKENFQRLLDVQNEISERKHAEYIGKTLRCLVDQIDEKGNVIARTPGGRRVHLEKDCGKLGEFVDVSITNASKWSLFGVIQK